MKSARVGFAVLFTLLLATHLCHSGILWAEEGLPLAAAAQMLRGKMLYRDIWFDKPPLLAAVYLLWDAQIGWLLRLAGALYVFAAAAMASRFAREIWGRREAAWAAGLLSFFLTFYLPSAVMPLAADLLMLLPHLAAVYFAWRRRPLASGVCAGAAFLFNPKGIVVLAVCAIWSFPAVLPLALGFALPNALAAAWLWYQGALPAYIEQVWIWGRMYAAGTFLAHPVPDAIRLTLNWAGFHAALVLAALWFYWKEHTGRWRWLVWGIFSLAGVVLGWRFFPRYFFQLLPVLVLAAARGFSLLPRKYAVAVLAFLLIPFLRFGPRYAMLAWEQFHGLPLDWADVAMDQDSRAAARLVRTQSGASDTLFVWGFRPELYVYTGMPAGARFLDSQPLTGVPADRHLTQSKPVSTAFTEAARRELTQTHPAFVLDGLGPYNPLLAIGTYPDLQAWLAQYHEIGSSRQTIIYQRSAANPASRPLP